jgi:hypothetical protein
VAGMYGQSFVYYYVDGGRPCRDNCPTLQGCNLKLKLDIDKIGFNLQLFWFMTYS